MHCDANIESLASEDRHPVFSRFATRILVTLICSCKDYGGWLAKLARVSPMCAFDENPVCLTQVSNEELSLLCIKCSCCTDLHGLNPSSIKCSL